MRASRFGLVLACAYVTLSLTSIACGYAAHDTKSRVVLLQLPLVPLMLLLGAARVLPLVPDVSWGVALGVAISITAAGFYGLGKMVGLINPKARLVIGSAVLCTVLFALFWPHGP